MNFTNHLILPSHFIFLLLVRMSAAHRKIVIDKIAKTPATYLHALSKKA